MIRKEVKEPLYYPRLEEIKAAAEIIKSVAVCTPLVKNLSYSERYQADVCFKREDMQPVRSYKIRGAYHKISSLKELGTAEIACASAGNHAQGVALSCELLKVMGNIFMPSTTPKQKIEQVKMFGKSWVKVILVGDTYDDAFEAASSFSLEHNFPFVHPFDDQKIIEGQGTVGLELALQSEKPIDFLFLPVGGGGLAAGVSAVLKNLSPQTKIIGVEPKGAPSMSEALRTGMNNKLDHIDKFIDGAAVKRVGDLNFNVCKTTLDACITVDEGAVCQKILDLYNQEGIIVEPAGALAVCGLDQYAEDIKGKQVVCIISGSNNDITRTEEIKERALLYKGLKHYFIVNFPQRAGALKQFVSEILGEDDDITFFQYGKKHSRQNGSAIVGIQLRTEDDLIPLINNMKNQGFYGEYLNDKPHLMNVLV
ncbi:MAG: threonine ammonia-lyase IlvA [Flavobacteriales bacterium]